MLFGNVGSSCWTIRTCHVDQATNPVLNHESLKNREVITTSGTSPWAFIKHVLYNGRLSAGQWFPPDHPPIRLTITI
jgi:hypothetical protein